MSLAELSLTRWRSLGLPAARRLARQAADQTGGQVVAVETVEHLGAPLHRVRIARQGREFALVPGGEVVLGFDADGWRSPPGLEADYAESAEQGYGYGPDLRSHLAQVLSPRRSASVPTVLMAVEDEPLTAPPAETPDLLAAEGLRMPSSDEWEHACGAGADTLFRWGDACPLDRVPHGDDGGPHQQPNAFGLRIAHDTYAAELTGDTGSVHGGDGGESVCGGYGTVLAWLPLATAQRNPAMAEFVYGPDGEDMYEEFSTRPVLALPVAL
ncbi:hypothetical protein [Streptomyces albidoflavus]|uniref:hypothetical protein n=1 Tax=Streptomyces albidoflavus TaxID=1886 RepID=UPI0004C8B5FD|nr:hypothetical protein [Streptomyces albidoflavus]